MEIQREVSQGDTARPSPKEKGCEEGGEGTGQGTRDRAACARDEGRTLLRGCLQPGCPQKGPGLGFLF